MRKEELFGLILVKKIVLAELGRHSPQFPVVIAQNGPRERADQIDALPRIGTVADDVPQAIKLLDALRLGVGERSLEGFEVAVNVAQDGSFHDSA